MPPTLTPTVLLAEDDPDLRELLRVYLELEGWRVEPLPDGVALLARLGAGPLPAAVVTDVNMPRLDGLAALERAGLQGRIPAVVMTAFGDRKTHRRGQALGARVLDKPVDPDTLVHHLRHVIREARR